MGGEGLEIVGEREGFRDSGGNRVKSDRGVRARGDKGGHCMVTTR